MVGYQCFFIDRATMCSQSGSNIVLLVVIRLYKAKSYHLIASWSVYYLRTFLQFYSIYHMWCISLLFINCRKNPTKKEIPSFIILTKIGRLLDRSIWIQSNSYFTVLYRKSKLTRRRIYIIKLSLTANVTQQMICTIKIRRVPTRTLGLVLYLQDMYICTNM